MTALPGSSLTTHLALDALATVPVVKCGSDFLLLCIGFCMTYNDTAETTEYGPCPYLAHVIVFFRHHSTLQIKYISIFEPKAGISTLYGFSSEGEMLPKEKCFRSAPINGGSDGTYKVAAAFTQLASGSKSTSVLTMQS